VDSNGTERRKLTLNNHSPPIFVNERRWSCWVGKKHPQQTAPLPPCRPALAPDEGCIIRVNGQHFQYPYTSTCFQSDLTFLHFYLFFNQTCNSSLSGICNLQSPTEDSVSRCDQAFFVSSATLPCPQQPRSALSRPSTC
jgi:hypothetical protein